MGSRSVGVSPICHFAPFELVGETPTLLECPPLCDPCVLCGHTSPASVVRDSFSAIFTHARDVAQSLGSGAARTWDGSRTDMGWKSHGLWMEVARTWDRGRTDFGWKSHALLVRAAPLFPQSARTWGGIRRHCGMGDTDLRGNPNGLEMEATRASDGLRPRLRPHSRGLGMRVAWTPDGIGWVMRTDS